jgi:hypothetical protein
MMRYDVVWLKLCDSDMVRGLLTLFAKKELGRSICYANGIVAWVVTAGSFSSEQWSVSL